MLAMILARHQYHSRHRNRRLKFDLQIYLLASGLVLIAYQHESIRVAVDRRTCGRTVYVGNCAEASHDACVEKQAADLLGWHTHLRLKTIAASVFQQGVTKLPQHSISARGVCHVEGRN